MKNTIVQMAAAAIRDVRQAIGLARMYEGGMGTNKAPDEGEDEIYFARAAVAVIYSQDVAHLVVALEKLACLGNGNIPGNSVGNIIAQGALNKFYEGHQ